MRRLGIAATLVFLANLVLVHTAQGQIAMTVQDPGTNPFGGNTWSLGYEFTANVDMEVTGLGFFDLDGDGLVDAHDVALWTAGGTLLASTTVDNTDPLTGFFRFRSVTPVQLTTGSNYVIASHDFLNDDAIRDDLSVISTVHPDITIVDGGFAFPSASIQIPNNFYGDSALFFNTASFTFTPVAEPTGSTLVWIGLLALVVKRRLG